MGDVVRLPRTQVVMVATVAGLAIAPAVVLVDRGSWDGPAVAMSKTGAFALWMALLASQTMLWALSFVPLVAALKRHWREREPIRREVLPSAVLLVALVISIVAIPAAVSELPEVIPHQRTKVRLLTLIALGATVLAAMSIWLIRGRVERLGSQEPSSDALKAFVGLRAELDRLLAFLGAIVGLAVLASAGLRNLTLLYDERNAGVGPVDFPPENVVLYGIGLSIVLATVYLPTFATFHQVGSRWRDRLAPFPAPDDLESGLDRRGALDDLLGLRVSATTAFKAGVAILSPLIGSLTSLLPTLGS